MKLHAVGTRFGGTMAALLLFAGCGRPWQRPTPKPQDPFVTLEAKETSKLSEKEYLMRKAVVGSRSERLEALDVIDRANDPDFLPFLLNRMEKEDDKFLTVRIMQALSRPDGLQDVRAVSPIRRIAVKDQGRVGMEAVIALFNLGDDNYVPSVIKHLRYYEEFPEHASIALRALKKMYVVELPPTVRAWNTYYRSHRLAPYQQLHWWSTFRPPEPPVVAGTTKVEPRPKGGPQLPQEDVRVRRTIVSVYEFWRPDEP